MVSDELRVERGTIPETVKGLIFQFHYESVECNSLTRVVSNYGWLE